MPKKVAIKSKKPVAIKSKKPVAIKSMKPVAKKSKKVASKSKKVASKSKKAVRVEGMKLEVIGRCHNGRCVFLKRRTPINTSMLRK
jgi:hypothetical protein